MKCSRTAAVVAVLLYPFTVYARLDFFDFSAPLPAYSRDFAHDLLLAWQGMHASFNSPGRTLRLARRAGTGSAKCSLRLVSSHNATSKGPAPTQTQTSAYSRQSPVAVSSTFTTTTLITDASTGPSSPATSKPATVPPSSTSSATPAPTFPASIFSLKHVYNGSSFFNGWDFFSGSDPTQGTVTYLDSGTAWSSGLASINSAGNAVMRIDTTPEKTWSAHAIDAVVSGTRNSVRIQTQVTFNGGLLVLDAVHMPHGCGTWPAFWTNGPNWPVTGEIDIVEGVDDSVQNLISLHTNPGCTVPQNSGSTSTSANGLDCAVADSSNTGCGQRSTLPNDYGSAFNSAGGGVYAMLWDNSGIQVFFFTRDNIPADLVRDAPLPNTWGLPAARFPSSTCNPYQFFQDHSVIFDTTLCGSWAGTTGSWQATNYAGQSASCQQITGADTCTNYVLNNGAAFADAYWEVVSVKLFQ